MKIIEGSVLRIIKEPEINDNLKSSSCELNAEKLIKKPISLAPNPTKKKGIFCKKRMNG